MNKNLFVLSNNVNNFDSQFNMTNSDVVYCRDVLIQRKDAATLLSISVPTLLKYERMGYISSYYIDGHFFYKVTDVLNRRQLIKRLKYRRRKVA